jgi:hypothetical protein
MKNAHQVSASQLVAFSLSGLLALASVACAGAGSGGRGWQNKRPQLYPNAHYQEVGAETAQYDVSDCMARADVGAPQRSTLKDGAINTAGGAAGGAALGAIAGAIAGNAGTGAAAGAAVGGAAGLGKTAYDSRKPAEGYQGYVEACLRDKGYEVISWQ